MRKIIITVPKKQTGKWKLSMRGRRGRGYKTAATAYNAVESSLSRYLEANLDEKTAVRVNYGRGFINESLTSNKPRYLLYALGCFLEDYLSDSVLNTRHKKYSKYSEDY